MLPDMMAPSLHSIINIGITKSLLSVFMNFEAKPSLVVMAAGIGSRYKGIKQLAPLGPHGETLLEYSMFDALRAGFGTIIIVLRKELEALFHDRILKRLPKDLDVKLAFQELAAIPNNGRPPKNRKKPWNKPRKLPMPLLW